MKESDYVNIPIKILLTISMEVMPFQSAFHLPEYVNYRLRRYPRKL